MNVVATTIKDIAKRVGVSASTVSLALRKAPTISPATSAKVCEAAEKLGFRPRSYRRRGDKGGLRTHNLLLLLSQRPKDLLRVPLSAALLEALESQCRKRDLQLSLVHCNGEESLPQWLTLDRLDGTLIFGSVPSRHRAHIQELRPVILLASVGGPGDHFESDRSLGA